MDICVVAEDPALLSTLGAVIGSSLVRSNPFALSPCDIHIWDFESAGEPSPDFFGQKKVPCVFLLIEQVNTSRLSSVTVSSAVLLLKPVNAALLKKFVDLAGGGADTQRVPARAERVEADRDALLNYVFAANLKLQENDYDRTNFLARALHDLRAPLTALHGYCGLLAEGQLGPVNARQSELLNGMQLSARRLSKQASGMFELSVLGNLRRKPQLVEGDIQATIAQAVEEVDSLCQEKTLDMVVNTEPPESCFLFETEQITQVLITLLENCCRFSAIGGSVEIRGATIDWDPASPAAGGPIWQLHRPCKAYRIDIQDEGPLFQAHLLSSIFEEYASYAGSSGRDLSGGGLGLAICKMIVRAHGGAIWAANTERGARFSFVLPLQPPEFVDPPQEPQTLGGAYAG